MIEAYKDYWKRYIDFKGKSNRLEFWTPVLVHIISIFIIALIGAFSFIVGIFIVAAVLSALIGLFGLANIVPMAAVTLRRLIILSVVVNIIFDIIQVDSIAVFLNIVSIICTIILVIETLLPSKNVEDAQLKWL